MNIKYILIIISLFCGNLYAQKDSLALQYARTITADDLSKHLHILASDEFEGRETGKIGQKLAAKYISDHFEKNNLTKLPNKTYLQPFTLVEKQVKAIKLSKGENFKDFYTLGVNETESVESEIVFAGFGIETENYSDYKNIDVKDKCVFILPGEPIKEGISYVTNSDKVSEWSFGWEKKIETAFKNGVKAVFILPTNVTKDFESNLEKYEHYLKKAKMNQKAENKAENKPYFFVSPTLAGKLFNTSFKKIEKQRLAIVKTGDNAKIKIKTSTITYSFEVESTEIATENVIGMVEGIDKKDEFIVISAHYDHIGVKGDHVYNGADDDGTGTVAIMELAEAFAQAKLDGNGPRRSILFAGMTGEEKGLLGSEYYSNNPIYPLENTVTNLNIDMIGRLDEDHPEDKNYVYLIGSDMLSTDLHNISEKANKTYNNIELDYRYNKLDDPNQYYYRSDHYNFAKHGIPVIFYFNGVHEDYHQHTDTVDKILFDKVENISRLVFYTAWEIANRDKRPVVDKEIK